MKSLTLVYQINDAEIESMLETLAETLKRTGFGDEGKVLIASYHGDAMAERDELKQLIEEFFLPVWPADYVDRLRAVIKKGA